MSLKEKIIALKKEKDAFILAHFYMPLEVQEVADVVGDSLEMAKRAAAAEQKLIIVCGVRFMAESAKILSPDKKVLIPVPDAGCPMADMITPEQVLELRKRFPDAAVMCYVNSSADVKAVSDICCTSASALDQVKQLEAERILFIPDKNLGGYIGQQVPEKEMILWPGCCPVHDAIKESDVIAAKERMPDAPFLVHPECRASVRKYADFIGSTSAILKYVAASEGKRFIIGTECEIERKLAKEFPDREFITVSGSFVCNDMKKVSLKDVYECLKDEKNEVLLPEETIEGAKVSLGRMIK